MLLTNCYSHVSLPVFWHTLFCSLPVLSHLIDTNFLLCFISIFDVEVIQLSQLIKIKHAMYTYFKANFKVHKCESDDFSEKKLLVMLKCWTAYPHSRVFFGGFKCPNHSELDNGWTLMSQIMLTALLKLNYTALKNRIITLNLSLFLTVKLNIQLDCSRTQQ